MPKKENRRRGGYHDAEKKLLACASNVKQPQQIMRWYETSSSNV